MIDKLLQTEYGLMKSDLSQARLENLCLNKIGVQTGPFGSQLHNEDYVETGIPIITVEHLGDNRINHNNTPFVSETDYNRLIKYNLLEGDIVFSRVGSVDRRALVRKEEDGWLFSGRCLRVRVDKEKIDPVYLSYFFGLESFKNYIRGIAVGATMPSINTKILSDVPVYYPNDLIIQKQIAKILGDLDDKIALNTQINQTLEAMAQALFKSWFVDFDPVKAKMEARASGGNDEAVRRAAMAVISGKSVEELADFAKANPEGFDELGATADLFPERLVESELGLIPEGWGVKAVSDIAKFSTMRVSASELHMENYISTENMIANKGGITIASSLPTTTTTPLFEGGHILVSNIRPYFQKIWLATFTGGRSNDVLGFVPKQKGLSEFVYHLMYQNSFFAFMMATSKGAKMPRGDKDAIMSYQLAYDKKIALYFSKKVKEFNELDATHKKESNALVETRDTLLPKLLSGEIDVSK